MAAKIKLGATPKSFKKTVTFQMLDGTEGSVECVYKYRTRVEFGEFIDKLMARADVQQEGEKFSMEKLMSQAAGSNADYLLQVLDGWNLDVDLGKESAQQLANEIPAAAIAIMETYRAACTEGRLGN
jgi:hypothetical protein